MWLGVDKEKIILVPISHVNKNKIHKNNDFMTLLAIESIENTINNAIEVS